MTHLTTFFWNEGLLWQRYGEVLLGRHYRLVSCEVGEDGSFKILGDPVKLYAINPNAEFKPWSEYRPSEDS